MSTYLRLNYSFAGSIDAWTGEEAAAAATGEATRAHLQEIDEHDLAETFQPFGTNEPPPEIAISLTEMRDDTGP
jgi:hypothetical protein